MPSRELDFPVFDADNHMYEPPEAFTKYLPKEYDGVVRYVEVNGRTKIALKGQISEYIPNPTFRKVAAPGAQEAYFKDGNPEGKSRREMLGKAIESPPAFFEPAPRVQLMDELGIDRALMWPTLASLLEERLRDDPTAVHVVVHALNEWMHETWTFNFDDRIFATPVIHLGIVERAIEELEWVLERGAKIILVRPAPVHGLQGPRSFALPEFDPFWKLVEQSGIVTGMHASDSGYNRYSNEWEGVRDEFTPFTDSTGFVDLSGSHGRAITDTISSAIGHGMCTRFPGLKIAPVENGSDWVRSLVARMQASYEFNPHAWDEDPFDTFKRCIFVHPFHEDDPIGLIDLIGVDNVLFGSDYPHPEGMSDPISFVDELVGLSAEDTAKVMGGNLARIMGVAA